MSITILQCATIVVLLASVAMREIYASERVKRIEKQRDEWRDIAAKWQAVSERFEKTTNEWKNIANQAGARL